MKPEIEHCPDARLAFEPLVSVLFARADSNYKSLQGVDVWDAERDALTWPGGTPVVAHPPCRAWGKFAMFAKPRDGERDLALWAVDQVRTWGGVLEHPAQSLLWGAKPLPEPGKRDAWGGWTLPIYQHWWGHKAQKATRLYLCGCEPKDLPPMPMRLGTAEYMVGDGGRAADGTRRRGRPEISKDEREHTPLEFARWLVTTARACEAPAPLLPLQQPADPVARVAVEADVSALAALVRQICTPEPEQHTWGYRCPACGRQWVGRQGFRLSAARRHVGACVPMSDDDRDVVRRWQAAVAARLLGR